MFSFVRLFYPCGVSLHVQVCVYACVQLCVDLWKLTEVCFVLSLFARWRWNQFQIIGISNWNLCCHLNSLLQILFGQLEKYMAALTLKVKNIKSYKVRQKNMLNNTTNPFITLLSPSLAGKFNISFLIPCCVAFEAFMVFFSSLLQIYFSSLLI